MKVTTFKNVDIDVEVDVSLEDVLNEFVEQIDVMDPERWRITLGILSATTNVLAKVPDVAIAHLRREARQEMFRRLTTQCLRYAPPDPGYDPIALGA